TSSTAPSACTWPGTPTASPARATSSTPSPWCSPRRERPWRASASITKVRGMAQYDRLTGLDASFLHLESVTQPMHVGSLAILEGGAFFDEAGQFRIEDAREIISSR